MNLIKLFFRFPINKYLITKLLVILFDQLSNEQVEGRQRELLSTWRSNIGGLIFERTTSFVNAIRGKKEFRGTEIMGKNRKKGGK